MGIINVENCGLKEAHSDKKASLKKTTMTVVFL